MNNALALGDLMIGALLVLGASTMVRRGEGGLRFSSIRVRRSDNPLIFWVWVSLLGGLGLAAISAAFYALAARGGSR